MSFVSKNPLLLAYAQQEAAGGISRSLRFNSSDSAYLSRGFSSGSQTTWTYSAWLKRTSLATSGLNSNVILLCIPEAATQTRLQLSNDSTIKFLWSQGTASVSTSAVFRDVSAWYHILFVWDTSNGTAADRAKLYINGSQVTLSGTSISSGFTTDINSAKTHNICRLFDGANNYYSDGYLADIHFIDGQALTPSSFTEVSATTGQLIPKRYTGSFGTNGFWLQFADNSNNTAATLGKDTSGNSPANNWTPNNLSVTAGAGNDSLVDVPTNGSQTDTGVGGEVRGNYAVLLDQYVTDKTRLTMANGNLDVTFNNSGSSSSALSSIGVSSGKWYSEFTCTQTGSNYAFVGIASPKNNNIDSLGYGDSYAYVSNTGNKANNGSFVSYGATWTANDVIGVALDLDAGTITFYKNGVSQGQAYSSISGTYIIGCTGFLNWKFSANFGQRPFAYTAPSGFKALCTANLPAPVVAKPNTVMDVATWSGDSAASRSITFSQSISPDLVWVKCRSNSAYHGIYDSVRGVNRVIFPNDTLAEINTPGNGYVSAFNSNGFTLTAGSLSSDDTNQSGRTYVGWAWDAGSSTVTNTQGSITSSVRANTSAGFSVVTYVGTGGTGGTVGHGLGVAPSLIIAKSRSASRDWAVYHKDLTKDKYLNLNSTAAASTTASVWGNAEPTSTVFGVYAWSTAQNNANGENMVAYCFAPVSGYSSMSSFVGNGSSDGVFVYTGFRPRYLFIKRSDSTGDWRVYDTTRSPYNTAGNDLLFNSSQADADLWPFDILSNGFKVRSSDARVNASGGTYIYFAVAESPFQYSRAR